MFAAADERLREPAFLGGTDRTWTAECILGGLSSGEGLIWAVRDPIEKRERVSRRGEPPAYVTVTDDAGVEDKRVLVQEAEFATVLKQFERQGNTLSPVLRQAWESGALRSMTKNSPARATGAHVSVVGHITQDELMRYLTATETANGLANRFLFCAARRSKLLPDGGTLDPAVLSALAGWLAEAIGFGEQADRLVRDEAASAVWRELYPTLSADRPGLAGSLLSRAEAHVVRLSLIYALLDASLVIGERHLRSAVAAWEYCERSVLHLFADRIGDPAADAALQLIRQAGAGGVSRTDIQTALGKHVYGDRLTAALGLLASAGTAHAVRSDTGGRPVERWFPGRSGGL